ncbi:MAG TPA: immunoglobulin domain-containing protein, partial [Verrucomicrobiota bacterium]|nr:immunoglobulin domain-containing protein [Verrucomicrobiota bacterium]
GYALALANSYGAVTSRVAQLTVLMVEPPQPPQITRQPVGGTNNVGATVTLSVQASGTPPLAYQWRKDNMDLPAATSPTLTLSSLRLGDAGEYNVRVSNTAGARFSGSARVVVNAPLPSARPEWLWAFQPGPSNNGFVFGLSCDTAQNVWMGGAVRGTAVFGDKTIRCDVGQESSMTVAQLNPAGTPLQALRLGGGGDGGAGTVLVQDSGDLLVVGSVDGDAMLLRLDSTGRALWSRPWTSATNSSTVAVDLATAADGSTYFNAMLLGTVKIGTSTIVSRGDADAILAKYDRAGEVVWLRQIGGRGTDQPFGPGVNAAGAVYTAGSFTMSLPLGPTNLVSRGSDAFLLKYDAAGTLLWARSGGGTDDELVTGFALTPQDHVYLAGAFLGTAEFGRISLPSLGGSDLFLVKYDAAGAVLWAKSVGSAIGDGEPVVGADTAGNAYLAGVSRGERLVLGGTTLTNTTGGGLVFVAKFDPNGGLQWVQSGAAVSDAALTDLLVDAAGNVYTSGYYDGVLGLGKLAIANQTQGLFIAKLGFAPVILSPPPALVTTNASAPVTLAVAAAGAEPLTYTWTKDGTTIPGATGPNLLLAGLPAGSVGVYRVTVSNPYGTTPTAESRVEVISGGLANVRAAQRPGTTFVDITYNLGGTAPVAVTVAASSDGGKTWTVPVRTVAGDVGASIQPGADRRIVWSAGTDWLNHQTAGFMVRVSIPGMQVTTPPLTVNTMQAGAWRLRVWADLNGNGTYDENVEGRNEALAGAEVYYGGRTEAHLLPGRTEADGTVAVAKAASAGEVVFARHRLEEVQAKKPFHDAVGKLMSTLWLDSDRGGTDTSNWDGQWLSRTLSSSEVTAAQAGQIVPVRVAHPVFEWHLVAALEPADAALAKRVMLGLAQASAYFYNVTDGQMKFGQVAIYTGVSTNAALWHNADLILFAENEYRANAALNGVRSAQPGWQMRFGATSRQSFPDEPMYFSSFVHEFGHYALGFLDEYLDGNGAFEPWEEYRKQHPDKVPSNYGLMDRDYLLPELSSFNDYLDRYPAPLAPATVSDHLYYFWKKSGFLLPCWQLFELAWERPYTGVPVEIVSPPPGHYDGYDQHSSNDRLKPDRVPAPYVYLQVSFEDPAG